jgi:MFS family permease
MTLDPYRRALALPGVRSLLLVSMLARVPVIATGITITLHVVLALDRGYAAAGLVGTAYTIGGALGAPVVGRVIDLRGARLVLAVTTLAQALFWSVAHAVPYPALLATALVSGVLMIPVFSLARQSIAALVPEPHRRAAFALDAMSVELSFIIGPALAVVVATTVSPRVAMISVGSGIVLGGLGLLLLDPPTRDQLAPPASGPAPRRREWLSARFVAVLAVAAATTLVLVGSDVAIVAVLRDSDQLQWASAVLVLWGFSSMLGGFGYGAAPRPLPPYLLLAVMCAATIPIGLVGGGPWWWLALAMLPAGLLCAPSLISATDAVSRLTPEAVRGEAMGWHNAANTVGLSIGGPLAGAVIDATSAGWGFAALGAVSLLVALAAAAASAQWRRRLLKRRRGTAGREVRELGVEGGPLGADPGHPVEVPQRRRAAGGPLE